MKFPPRIQDFVPPDAVKQLVDLVGQPTLLNGLKDAAQRLGWKESWNPSQLQEAMVQAKRWMESLADRLRPENTEIRHCINGTGEVFSSRYLSSPQSVEGIRLQAMVLEGYVQGKVLHDYATTVKQWSGAEDVLAVTSLPQAISLLAKLPEAHSGWMIPRQDCLRFPHGPHPESKVDLIDLISIFGTKIFEVGASNNTSELDLQAPFASGCRSLLTVEQRGDKGSNLEHRQSMLAACKKNHALYGEVLLHPSAIAIPDLVAETETVRSRIEAGVDLIVCAGDGLLGGPPCGLLIGRSAPIQSLAPWVQRLGCSLDAGTLALLHASMKSLVEESDWQQTAVGSLIATSLENLNHRARRLLAQIQGSEKIKSVQIETMACPLGSEPWQGMTLPSPVLIIEPSNATPETLQSDFHQLARPIHGKVCEKTWNLVVRTMDPSEDSEVVRAFWPSEG